MVDARADELHDDERHRGQHCGGGTQLTMRMATELHRVVGWGSRHGTTEVMATSVHVLRRPFGLRRVTSVR